MQVLLRQAITGFRRIVERLYQVVFHGLLSVYDRDFDTSYILVQVYLFMILWI